MAWPLFRGARRERSRASDVGFARFGGRLAHREGDGNGGADAFGAGNGDVAAVLDDDAADAGETETGAGEEVEDVGTAAEALENEREIGRRVPTPVWTAISPS